MLPRQPPPTKPKHKRVPMCWLITDARLGDALPGIIAALPPRSAVVVRPYALRKKGQVASVRAIRRVARAKRHLLLLGGAGSAAGYDGRHGTADARKARKSGEFLSMPVHNRRELGLARRLRADALLISPVYTTRSHPGAASLGRRGFARVAAPVARKAIALGGMNAMRFESLRHHGAVGWAAIDAWLQDKKQ